MRRSVRRSSKCTSRAAACHRRCDSRCASSSIAIALHRYPAASTLVRSTVPHARVVTRTYAYVVRERSGVVQTEAVDHPQLVDLLISHRHDVCPLSFSLYLIALCLAMMCSRGSKAVAPALHPRCVCRRQIAEAQLVEFAQMATLLNSVVPAQCVRRCALRHRDSAFSASPVCHCWCEAHTGVVGVQPRVAVSQAGACETG